MNSNEALLHELDQRLIQQGLSQNEVDHLRGLIKAVVQAADEQNLPSLLDRLMDTLSKHGRLLAIIEQQAAELDALKRIALNLTSSLDLQVVLESVVKEALRLVPDAEDAHIYLYQDGKITFGASLFIDGRKNLQFSEPRPDGLTWTVARTGKVLVVEDMSDHPLFKNAASTWHGSIVGVPICTQEMVLGVMNLARSKKGKFDEAELRLLSLLADQAAIAIINAHLHQLATLQAYSDILTKLPNRRALDERLDQALHRSRIHQSVFCVMMMDLDGFKQVNDTYGHDVGDRVLQQLADLLLHTVRSSDFLARYGGDEMTLVLPETGIKQALLVAQKISKKLSETDLVLSENKTIRLGISGGIACYPSDGQTASALLRAADEVLYRAKRRGENCFVCASTDHA